jgi:hypothetical protein
LASLYEGNPRRETERPSTEQLLSEQTASVTTQTICHFRRKTNHDASKYWY